MKPLISAPNHDWAQAMAKDLGLGPRDFIYIPPGGRNREERLAGRSGYSADQLHGYFTNREVFYLTLPLPDKPRFPYFVRAWNWVKAHFSRDRK